MTKIDKINNKKKYILKIEWTDIIQDYNMYVYVICKCNKFMILLSKI